MYRLSRYVLALLALYSLCVSACATTLTPKQLKDFEALDACAGNRDAIYEEARSDLAAFIGRSGKTFEESWAGLMGLQASIRGQPWTPFQAEFLRTSYLNWGELSGITKLWLSGMKGQFDQFGRHSWSGRRDGRVERIQQCLEQDYGYRFPQ